MRACSVFVLALLLAGSMLACSGEPRDSTGELGGDGSEVSAADTGGTASHMDHDGHDADGDSLPVGSDPHGEGEHGATQAAGGEHAGHADGGGASAPAPAEAGEHAGHTTAGEPTVSRNEHARHAAGDRPSGGDAHAGHAAGAVRAAPDPRQQHADHAAAPRTVDIPPSAHRRVEQGNVDRAATEKLRLLLQNLLQDPEVRRRAAADPATARLIQQVEELHGIDGAPAETQHHEHR